MTIDQQTRLVDTLVRSDFAVKRLWEHIEQFDDEIRQSAVAAALAPPERWKPDGLLSIAPAVKFFNATQRELFVAQFEKLAATPRRYWEWWDVQVAMNPAMVHLTAEQRQRILAIAKARAPYVLVTLALGRPQKQ